METQKKSQDKSILLTVMHLGPGGVQSLVISLSIELVKRKFNIILLSYVPILNTYQQKVYNNLKKNGVNIILPKSQLNNPIQRFFFTLKIFRYNKVGLIHIHTPIPNLYLSIPSFFFGIKQVLTFHSVKLWNNSNKYYKENIKLKIANLFIFKFIAISQTVKQSMIKNYSINKNKIEVIYNGVNIKKYKKEKINNELKEKLTKDINSFVITQIGTIDFNIKNQDKIVKLYDKIIKVIPNVIILFVGIGKDLERLNNSIKNKKRILTVGNRDDINEILSFTDVVILPSSNEGLPMVLLETMASGTPIIATTVGSIPEVIDDLQSGLLFNYNDFNQIVNKLVLLYNNKELRESISSNAKNSVNKFSFTKFLNNHIKLYNEISI